MSLSASAVLTLANPLVRDSAGYCCSLLSGRMRGKRNLLQSINLTHFTSEKIRIMSFSEPSDAPSPPAQSPFICLHLTMEVASRLTCAPDDYPALLEAAHVLHTSGKPQHARTLLWCAEALQRRQKSAVTLSPTHQAVRQKILSYLPKFGLSNDPKVEISFIPAGKMLLSQRPTVATGDSEELEDIEDSDTSSGGLQAVFDLYHNDRIVEAYTQLSALGLPPSSSLSNPVIADILQDYEEVQLIFNNFQESSGWELVGSAGEITIRAKMSPDLPTISIKSEGVIDIPIERLLCLMYEADLYSEWVPFCRVSRTLGSLTRVRKVIYEYFRVPIISNREIVVLGYGVNLLKHSGTLLVVAKSVPNEGDFKGVPLPPLNKDNVRAQVNFLGALIRPLTRTRTHMQLITNFDPLVSGVPYKVLNWLSRKFARKIFKLIKKQAKKFEGSPHQQRMNDGGEFYRYISEALEEFFADNAK